MDRRFLPIALALALVLAACGGKRAPAPEQAQEPDAAGAIVLTPPLAPAPPAPAMPDAAPDPPTPPIDPADVLSGPAAEAVIAELPGPSREAAPDPELRIHHFGVGPYEIGMTRREVAELLGKRGRYRRVRTPPGEVSVEHADLIGPSGLIFMRMKIYGGRVAEITVLGADGRTRTDAGIAVGSTFEDATLAHGDASPSGRGYVLSDLPGVVFVPQPPAPVRQDEPPPAARIGRIIVIGTESD